MPNVCPTCGTQVPPNSPLGFCPRCLIDQGRSKTHNPGGEFDDSRDGHKSAIPSEINQFDRYPILAELGRGATGIVFKARDTDLDRPVALKVLNETLASSSVARERFRREAKAAAAISHENVVTVHAVGEWRNQPYLVMEYISGRSLEDRITTSGAPTIEETLRIARQLLTGLAAAHDQGLIHRDIKPSNILLENSVERVKITDFGLARAVEEERLTLTGYVAGTPGYMAPEQLDGKEIDTRADLFSVGCVLYTLITGYAPFRGSSVASIMRKVAHEAPRSITELNPECPKWFVQLIEELLQKDPDARPRSARETLARLDAKSKVTATCATGRDERRTSMARRWLLGIGIPATLILLGLFLNNLSDNSKRDLESSESSATRFSTLLAAKPRSLPPIPSPRAYPPSVPPEDLERVSNAIFIANLPRNERLETRFAQEMKTNQPLRIAVEAGDCLAFFVPINFSQQRRPANNPRNIARIVATAFEIPGGFWTIPINPTGSASELWNENDALQIWTIARP